MEVVNTEQEIGGTCIPERKFCRAWECVVNESKLLNKIKVVLSGF